MKKELFSFRRKLLEDHQSKWQQYLEIFLSSWLILQESHTKKCERLQLQWNKKPVERVQRDFVITEWTMESFLQQNVVYNFF